MTGLLAAFVRTCWTASLIPKRILTAGYYLYGWSSERKGRDDLTAMVMVVVPQVMAMVECLRLAAPRLLPVTTRELPYLNTMHYIVRVISYISPLNKHRLNI